MLRQTLERAFRGRRVLVTGHTGFKGAWLCILLDELGADVSGLSLPAMSDSLYQLAGVSDFVREYMGDIRSREGVQAVLREVEPEFVLHLAAQSLVPESFRDPVGTFEVNVGGTAMVLDVAMRTPSVRTALVVTSDKVYANDGAGRAFVESDALGAGDPYSASKAGAELVVQSWRHSFPSGGQGVNQGAVVVSARAGNVVGGGDRADARLVPDVVRALERGVAVGLRHPEATRPWQFVLEPLLGYLLFVARVRSGSSDEMPAALNFGPDPSAVMSVRELVECCISEWGGGSWQPTGERAGPEAQTLALDSSAASEALGWRSLLEPREMIRATMEWYRSASAGGDCAALSRRQVESYLALAENNILPVGVEVEA